MRYCEAAASPALSGTVHCFWFLSGDASTTPEIVCPDGRMEVIFNLAQPMCRVQTDGGLESQPRSFLVGQMLSPTKLVAPGKFHICGVRFRHDGAWQVFGNLKEFAGGMVATDDVWGAAAETLREQLWEADSIPARAALLDRFLLRRLRETRDEAVSHSVRSVLSSGGGFPVRELARRSGWSERHHQRRFEARIGLSPKEFSRVIRFQHTLRRMEHETPLSAALACGYFDQPHFIREFKALSGSTPNEYWRRLHPMSVFYNTQPPDPVMMVS